MKDWFSVDRDGLRKIGERLVERRGFGILGAELYQNVMDTNATKCEIFIQKVLSRPLAFISVTDNDPEGFIDLSHAWTMFAPSLKRSNPEQAGRFNMGEKFVLAFCRDAKIHTTKGTVVFDKDGRRNLPKTKRAEGTEFSATIDCKADQLKELIEHMGKIIPKNGLVLTVNGAEIPHRTPVGTVRGSLATEIANEEGEMKATVRICDVDLYEPLPGEKAMIYELGIPVVETGDLWHYDVRQKVPLNMDRDNVTPAFLRDLRVLVLNNMHNQIKPEETESTWVNEATSSPKAAPEALQTFKTLKYGEKAVAYDPFNADANAEALLDKRTLIPNHGLTKGQRENLKSNGLLISSSQAYPTAGRSAYSDDPNALPAEVIPYSEWTKEMKRCHDYTQGVAAFLIGKEILVEFVKVPKNMGGWWRACYGTGHLFGKPSMHYNVSVLPKNWFDSVHEDMDSLILHELGHEFCANHADSKYLNALTDLGAKLKTAVLKNPEFFKKFS